MAREDGYVGRDEAAKLAGVHFNTIRLWEVQGKLHPKRVTRGARERVLISVKELDEVVSERGRKFAHLPGGALDREVEMRERIARLETERDMLRQNLEEKAVELRTLTDRLLQREER